MKNKYKNLSAEQVKQKIEDSVWQAVYDKDDKDNYYKETRYDDGSISIQSKHNGRTLDLMGGPGFAKQYDEAFDKAMKVEVPEYKNK